MRRQAAGRGAHAAKDECFWKTENRTRTEFTRVRTGCWGSRGSIYGNSCAPPIFNTEYELVPLLGSANSSYSVLKIGVHKKLVHAVVCVLVHANTIPHDPTPKARRTSTCPPGLCAEEDGAEEDGGEDEEVALADPPEEERLVVVDELHDGDEHDGRQHHLIRSRSVGMGMASRSVNEIHGAR